LRYRHSSNAKFDSGIKINNPNTNTTGKAKLVEGRIIPALFKLAAPMLVGLAAITIFNLADTFFIAKLGTTELAAISFTFPIVVLIAGLTLGLGVGVTALIAQKIGKGEIEEVRRITRDGLILAVSIVVVVCTVGVLTIDPVFRMMGASENILPFIKEYMLIWYSGVAFVIIPMVGNSAIRGTGNTLFPALIMVFAAVVNIILDPLLIFGLGPFPALGLKGAAIATVIGRGTTLVFSLWVLIKQEKLLSLTAPKLVELKKHWKSILVVGGPAGFTNVMTPVAAAVITWLVSTYGPTAVAGIGAGVRVEGFINMLPAAIGSGLAPFIGQNWGAKRPDRVRRAIKLSNRFLFVTGFFVYFLVVTFAHQIAGLFASEPEVARVITMFLRIVLIGFAFESLFVVSTSGFNALRRPRKAVSLHMMRLFIFHVPFAYGGSIIGGLPGIFVGLAIAKVLTGCVGYLWIKRVGKREIGSSSV